MYIAIYVCTYKCACMHAHAHMCECTYVVMYILYDFLLSTVVP